MFIGQHDDNYDFARRKGSRDLRPRKKKSGFAKKAIGIAATGGALAAGAMALKKGKKPGMKALPTSGMAKQATKKGFGAKASAFGSKAKSAASSVGNKAASAAGTVGSGIKKKAQSARNEIGFRVKNKRLKKKGGAITVKSRRV